MSIEYPGKVLCPNCKNFISLDFSEAIANTTDILSLKVNIPQSAKSGSDANKNKQDINPEGHYLLICKFCKVILGVIPGDTFLWKHSKS